ncbi:acyl-CoA-binding domain-containing protein 4 isoform X1 [Rhea pennata]|uniref:acyl-CoA-binding domain-containing protein 4 isoform X1 n=1 Tax=Rhea pennata TaxID=8795 RepID=UPI002E259436
MEEAAAAGCGAQFRAAVRVIQGLPRSGSYRPSYEEMLRFYSYYKQATAGRCQGPRPGFWDPIGRYKWDAWHSLGCMSKEEAMAAYVAEMKKVAQKVIDTVPMDEATQEMFEYFEPLYEVIRDMPRPPEAFFKRKGGSQEQVTDPNGDSQEGSLSQDRLENAVPEEQKRGEQVAGDGQAPATEALEGSQVTSDSEGEVYCDTLEHMEPDQAGQLLAKQGLSLNGIRPGPEPPVPRAAREGERGEGRRLEGKSSTGLGSERDPQLAAGEQDAEGDAELACTSRGMPEQLDARVVGAVRALQADMQRVLARLSQLEALTSAQVDLSEAHPDQLLTPQAAFPWPLAVSPHTLLFLVTWPFVAQWLLRRLQGRKR